MSFPSRDQRPDRWVRRAVWSIWIAAFGLGTYTHLWWVLHAGFMPDRQAPLWANLYWTSLTVLDPLAILLIVLGRARAAIVLGLCIMISNVIINSWASFGLNLSGYEVSLPMQTAFFGFVAGSALYLWPRAKTASRESGAVG
jgi:hypothetical protein